MRAVASCLTRPRHHEAAENAKNQSKKAAAQRKVCYLSTFITFLFFFPCDLQLYNERKQYLKKQKEVKIWSTIDFQSDNGDKDSPNITSDSDSDTD